MNSLWKAISSSIGQKTVVGITGLLLIGFVVTHLAGNLLIYAGNDVYNAYAHALHANPVLPVAEIGLLVLFILHIALAIQVSREYRRARPQNYVRRKSKQGRSPWTPSAVMLVSGIFILGFILLHLADLSLNLRNPAPEDMSPALRTLRVLQDPISGTVYFLGSLFLGYHLLHAFQSVFQTLGLNHKRYTPWIKKIGVVLACLLGLGFASFPVWGFLIKMGVLS